MDRMINVRIPEKLRADLVALSQEEGVPVSKLAREAIRGYIAVKKFRRARGMILPFAEAAGFLTDEDVFKRLK
jgi:transposase-like protein